MRTAICCKMRRRHLRRICERETIWDLLGDVCRAARFAWCARLVWRRLTWRG